MPRFLVFFVLADLLIACSSTNSLSPAREMSIRYAEIVSVDRVPAPSAAPVGAIVGGITGLILSQGSNRDRRLLSTAAGAAIGGLGTAAFEGDRRSYRYRVRYNNDTETDYITENGFLSAGDCVAIENRNYANIRRVSNALCEVGARPQEIQTKSLLEANQCHEAKDQLLAATSTSQVEQATRKVRILCQF